jgi:6-phosphogluconolactonase
MSTIPNENREQEILVCPDAKSVALEAASTFLRLAAEAIRYRGRFTVALSGGSTPRSLFEILATSQWQKQVDWKNVHLFWGDERYVPDAYPESNFRMTLETLLSRVPVPPVNVRRIKTELSPAEEAAASYEAEIARFFGTSPGQFPSFDLVFLGLGANAHTASLFPHSKALHVTSRLVVAEFVAEVGMWRITMTAPLLNAARNVIFLVCGSDKAPVLRDVLFGDHDSERKPAQLIRPASRSLTWLIDSGAAAQLPRDSYRVLPSRT